MGDQHQDLSQPPGQLTGKVPFEPVCMGATLDHLNPSQISPNLHLDFTQCSPTNRPKSAIMETVGGNTHCRGRHP